MQVVCCWLLCLGLAAAAAVLQRDQVAQSAIKLYRSKGVRQGHSWGVGNCKRLVGLLRQKNVAVKKLAAAADAVGRDRALSESERLFQVHTLEVFQKELNESENLVFQAVHSLQRALQGDLRDVVNMKESSRQRLEALREAAIKEEQEFVELVAAEKHQQEAAKSVLAQNKTLSMLDEILEDVRKAADRLEEEIEEHAFDNNKQMKGVNVEAVLRVEDDDENGGKRSNKSRQKEVEDDLWGLSMLIDSQNNQYVLTKPRDSTMPRADHHFIKSMVQVETLGELGVFFTLFVVGLEFSPERLQKVLVSLAAVLLLCLLLRTFLIGPYYKKLHAESKGNKEILVLGMAAFVFFMLTVTEFMDVSMELGCFLAGALLSTQGHMVTAEVMGCIEPIRDFLAIIFFASIGLHVFPTFVLYELTILLVLTLSLVIMKFVMAVLVLSAILPPGSRHIRWIVSAGLAQVSEFSFVLSSRARRAGIISREVYLLVLSVTTLSLLLAPVLWRVTTHRWVSRAEHKTVP
ncbi:hypothetical protein F2P81_004265 [Scophthalmus maximus]|uniref:Cation/H+ exchanger transmembrane domain-containing protein n=1 Tax=Scophthalmus maximus TaxID=52904 RepID=A0A6A4TES1_SCOMX|nr:hypothetical protein F2P81_004265 [Scophthalmus maximus]